MTLRPWEIQTGPFLAGALDAAGKGWRVFPLKPDGKVPITSNGYKDATTDVQTIREWWNKTPNANIGIATGEVSGFSVVDVDIKDGRAGEESAQKLGLPFHDTLTVRTASGGWHYYFAHTEGFRNRAGLLPGIDTRGDGGYVVGPGSVIDGEMYDVANVGDIRPMPESVARLVGQRAEPDGDPKPDTEAFQVSEDEVKRIRAALGYLDADPFETWVQVGMALYELAGGSDQMFDLWNWWSTSSAKYDGATMRKRWQSFASDRGDKITEATFWHLARVAGYQDDTNDVIFVPEVDDSLVFNINELDAWQAPPLQEIELWRNSIIARGNMTLIAGPPKIGKSMFVQHLLMGAASGRDFLGHSFDRPLRVLWMQAEIRKVYLKAGRINPAIAASKYSKGELAELRANFYMTDRLDLEITNKREFNILAKSVAELAPDILVIDPVINFSAAKENDARETKDLLRATRQLARAAGENADDEPALVVVHHTRKIDKRNGVGPDPFENIRGSGAFRGYYDSGVMLLPDESGAIAVHFETRNEKSPAPIGAKYNNELSAWELVELAVRKTGSGRSSALSKSERTDRIIELLNARTAPGYMTAGELNEAVQIACECKSSAADNYMRQAKIESPSVIKVRKNGQNTLYYHHKFEKFLRAEFDG